MTDDRRPRYGTKRHWQQADATQPQRVRSSGAALRAQETDKARLDVMCPNGRRYIARVVDRPPNRLNALVEVRHGSVNVIDVATAPIVVDCRNHTHELGNSRSKRGETRRADRVLSK